MNEEVYVILLLSGFGIMIAMVLVWFVIISKYFGYIRDHHPELYKQLGEPRLFAQDDAASDISFVRYVFSKDYLQSNDEQLIAKSLRIKKLIYLYFVAFSVIVGGIIIAAMASE